MDTITTLEQNLPPSHTNYREYKIWYLSKQFHTLGSQLSSSFVCVCVCVCVLGQLVPGWFSRNVDKRFVEYET